MKTPLGAVVGYVISVVLLSAGAVTFTIFGFMTIAGAFGAQHPLGLGAVALIALATGVVLLAGLGLTIGFAVSFARRRRQTGVRINTAALAAGAVGVSAAAAWIAAALLPWFGRWYPGVVPTAVAIVLAIVALATRKR